MDNSVKPPHKDCVLPSPLRAECQAEAGEETRGDEEISQGNHFANEVSLAGKLLFQLFYTSVNSRIGGVEKLLIERHAAEQHVGYGGGVFSYITLSPGEVLQNLGLRLPLCAQ